MVATEQSDFGVANVCLGILILVGDIINVWFIRPVRSTMLCFWSVVPILFIRQYYCLGILGFKGAPQV